MKSIGQLATVRILALLLVATALVTAPSIVANSGSQSHEPYTSPLGTTLFATSIANATGTLSVQWGDPYLPAILGQGNGIESLSVHGSVTPRSDLGGAYTYVQPTTEGELEAEWNTSSTTYSVDVYFYQGNSEYNRTTIFPSANTFAAMYIYFGGELTVNGVTTEISGLAALVATAPGFFSFQGTARTTYVVLYSATYHGDQYVFRWSQTDQIISGLEQPASDTLVQSVFLT